MTAAATSRRARRTRGPIGWTVAAVAVTAVYGPGQAAQAADVRGAAMQGEMFGTATAAGDFNGDGHADLAVGVPEDDVRQGGAIRPSAGVVNVVYGSGRGLRQHGNQLWTQDSPGILGDAEDFDRFGAALAAGDFDRDGFADLAIGAPGEALTATGSEKTAAGAVHILFGSRSGLRALGARRITQDSRGIRGRVEFGDAFGAALQAGRFGRGAPADLAIGAPGESLQSEGRRRVEAGAVHVVYGSPSGPSPAGDQVLSQASRRIGDSAEDFDQFGLTLAGGNFGNGRLADLVVGVPFEGLRKGGVLRGAVGAVHVVYGAPGGLRRVGSQTWSQDSRGIGEATGADDQFGGALAAGNFGSGPQADLAIGVPLEDRPAPGPGRKANVGVVQVLSGTTTGLRATGDRLWSQDSPGIEGVSEGSRVPEAFGNSLAAGRLDAGGHADLAVGVCENRARVFGLARGAVHVIRGSKSGLRAGHDALWNQSSPGVPGRAEDGDQFACSASSAGAYAPSLLATGDFGAARGADLAVGVPGENPTASSVGSQDNSGAVTVLYGARVGLQAAGSQSWHERIP